MKKIVKIGKMGCEHCRQTIEEYLKKQGVKAKVSLENNNATIECDEKITLDDIKRYIEETGYEYLGEE